MNQFETVPKTPEHQSLPTRLAKIGLFVLAISIVGGVTYAWMDTKGNTGITPENVTAVDDCATKDIKDATSANRINLETLSASQALIFAERSVDSCSQLIGTDIGAIYREIIADRIANSYLTKA